METNQVTQNQDNVQSENKLIGERKHIYNSSKFSFESSHHFDKVHKRKFHSFGSIHELVKLPGAMF